MLELKLAIRFIFNLKKASFSSYASLLTIIGIAIGVAALMLTASIIDGFENEVSNKLAGIEGKGRLKHFLNKPINLDDNLLKPVLNNSNFEINPYVKGVCMIRKGKNLDGVLIEGVRQYPKLVVNENLDYTTKNQIVLGGILASNLGAKIGDKIYLQSFSDAELSFSSSKVFSCEVVHIFFSGLHEYDKNIVYLNIETAQSILGYGSNEVNGLIIEKDDNLPINVSYPYYYETWKERHSLLFEWMLVQQWPAYIMFGLITFVGLINLFAAIAMIIIEKNGPITILLSQGMNDRSLRSVFMLQGGIIGTFGVLIGGIFSVLIISIQTKYSLFKIPQDIYFMDHIPFFFSISKYIVVLIIVCILSIIASWLPTLRFKSLNPSNVLRYE
ncbi:MAG: hypothetical protein CMG63_04165 [Candidatus Marinimicrobia bacterium]|nr:hypothetical protein [Candidatus Neomarinimicrobiota bacterium]